MSTKNATKFHNFFWKFGNTIDTAIKERKKIKMKQKNQKPSEKAIKKINKKSEEIAEIWSGDNNEEINSDVLGSYTGNPTETDRPIQDADDL